MTPAATSALGVWWSFDLLAWRITMRKRLFGESKNTNSEEKPEELFTRRIIEGLRKADKLYKTPDRPGWRRAFKILLKHHPAEEISQTLRWFLKHQDVAKVSTAYTFCEKYDRIHASMLIEPLPDDQLTKATRQIITNLGGLDTLPIPTKLKKHLPAIAQRSHERSIVHIGKVDHYFDRLLAAANTDHYRVYVESGGRLGWTWDDAATKEELAEFSKVKGRLQLIHHLREVGLFRPITAVQMWMELLVQDCMRWKEWNGYAEGMIFDPKSLRYNRLGTHFTAEWCNNSDRWDNLIKEILS
jgi:hypothetical protein